MSVIEKAKTLAWFAGRPAYWQHAGALARRKFGPDLDSPALCAAATAWAAERAVPLAEALAVVGLEAQGPLPALSPETLAEARERMALSQVEMGGAGDLDLLHAVAVLSGATRVIETGVAYGWSSLSLLSAIAERPGARLVSVDMPYPKMGNDPFVGIVVPDHLRPHWTLLREPDRPGIERAIALVGQPLDLVHYDSDKSHAGRRYGYPLLWNALRPGGIFISDDIQDNFGFREFMERTGTPFAVTGMGGRYVGMAVKPPADGSTGA